MTPELEGSEQNLLVVTWVLVGLFNCPQGLLLCCDLDNCRCARNLNGTSVVGVV
jgi:hypothetical protein